MSNELYDELVRMERAGNLLPDKDSLPLSEMARRAKTDGFSCHDSCRALVTGEHEEQCGAAGLEPPGRRPSTHIAGPMITVLGRYMRQRCSWCGYVLDEYDLERVAAPKGQSGFPVGEQVFVDPTRNPVVSYVIATELLTDDGSEGKLAEDSCVYNPLTTLSFG